MSVLWSRHWHNAQERSPLGDDRILFFAKGGRGSPGGGSGSGRGRGGGRGGGRGQPGSSLAPPDDDENGPGENIVHETDVNSEEGARAVPQEAPAQVAEASRGRLAETLQPPEQQKPPAPARELLVKVERLVDDFAKRRAALEAISQAPELPPEEKAKAAEMRTKMMDAVGTVDFLQRIAEGLARWESGKMDPLEYATFLETVGPEMLLTRDPVQKSIDRHTRKRGGTPPATAQLRGMIGETRNRPMLPEGSEELPDISGVVPWETYNESTRLLVVDQINQRALSEGRPIFASLLDDANKLYESLESQARDAKKMAEDAKNKKEAEELRAALTTPQAAQTTFTGSASEAWQNAKDFLGVEFYSPLQIWEGMKTFWEQLNRSIKSSDTVKANLIANMLGKMTSILPFDWAQDTERLLNQKVEEDNETETDAYKKYLARKGAYFNDLFVKTGNEMDTNRSNPNRIRAIMEFAASKGFLNDLVKFREQGTAKYYVFGRSDWALDELLKDMGGIESDRYKKFVDKLDAMQSSGTASERKDGKEYATGRCERYDQFVEQFEGAIDGHNYWFALGIADRAIEKGKESYMGSKLALIMMRHLQTEPNAKRYINAKFLEDLGVVGARSALNLGFMNFQRSTILPWAERQSPEQRQLEAAGGFGTVIDLIEQEIAAKDPELDRRVRAGSKEDMKKRDEIIAKVLSAQRVEMAYPDATGKKRKISIYQTKFKVGGAHFAIGSPVQGDPPDFRSLAEDFVKKPSELFIANADILKVFFGFNAQGQFSYGTRALWFMTRIWEEAEEYKKLAAEDAEWKAVYENYLKIMSKKLTDWIITQQNTQGSDGFVKQKFQGEDIRIIPGLIKAGLIDVGQIDPESRLGKALRPGQGSPAPADEEIEP